MGRSEVIGAPDYNSSGKSDEIPEHAASIAAFALDKYEITVGRFRKFVEAYDTWHGGMPSNPLAGTGQNLNADESARETTGWEGSWSPSVARLPADSAALRSSLGGGGFYETWTNSAGSGEAFPINCVSWYNAFAFCVWDGGRLPTEAEWEYAAAGGTENRMYPWGAALPGDRANYLFAIPKGTPSTQVGGRLDMGGAGYFGHADLAGSLSEWTLDWYSSNWYAATCNNCANTAIPTDTNASRVARGGNYMLGGYELRAAMRYSSVPENTLDFIGFRCARQVQ